jgi:hypothetical protein
MKRLMIATAVLSTFAGIASMAVADDGPVYHAARCRRYISPCPSTYVYRVATPTTVYQKNEINVYSRYNVVAKAPAYFSRVPSPQYRTPVDGPDLVPGRTYTLKVNYLMEKPGYVNLYIFNTSHSCQVLTWGPNEVTFEVPNIGVVASGARADLEVVRPDGFVALRRGVDLINPPDLIEHEELPPGTTAGQMGAYPFAAGPMLSPATGG